VPRRCTVCDAPKRDAIDRALVARERPFRHIAKRHRLSLASVYRHFAEHLPAALAKAQGAREAARGDDLLGRLLRLHRTTLAILREAREASQPDLALKAIARAEKQLELQAQLIGRLQPGATVNVLVTPEWRAVQGALLTALAPFPDARVRVASALAQFDREGAGAALN